MISGRFRARKILRKIEIQQKPRISAFMAVGLFFFLFSLKIIKKFLKRAKFLLTDSILKAFNFPLKKCRQSPLKICVAMWIRPYETF